MATVFANGRSIVHQGDGNTNTAAPPDVCKTPSPGGPIPVPYVNIAKDGDLASGSKKVTIEGNPVGLESSNLSTSTGDEPGAAGGIISSKTKGKMTWASSSLDVKIEGKAVVRFMDVAQHNGNTFNTVFAQQGGVSTGWVYGDDSEKCALCEKDPSTHKSAQETDGTKAKANQLAAALKVKGLFTKEDGTVVDGMMIAVVQCSCHPGVQVYAHSGVAAIAGFGEAMGAGWTLANERVGIHNFRNFKGKTQSDRMQRRKVETMFTLAREKWAEAREGKTRDTFNSPGTCAGPKALNKAHELQHDVKFMTEQWVKRPPNAGENRDDINDMRGSIEYGIVGRERERLATVTQGFKDGDTVPSCGTCKVIVMAALCSDEERSCKATR